MKVFIYSVYDEKAGAYAPPFFMQRDGIAYRTFGDAVNDSKKDTNMSVHPEDFSLYRLGSYDDESGKIVPETPVFLVKGSTLKIKL